ncbi:MAG TPA: methyl-accepting chemotaxis protein [Myxococcota bacterium]|nr:methyl-accepting chemotaxis protein [Myxococcota bacterium]HRY95660.1 methyl-accepting chemotaxis protein [Myxococcota bacterium]HSA21286.1 methyl-accepting chemotaxis protein [Myxococcota bacterium]
MRFIRNLSLKWKLFGSAALVMALITLVMLSYYPASQNRALADGLRAKVTAVATMLSSSLAPAVQFQQMAGVEEIFGGAAKDAELKAVRVEDMEGKRLAGLKDDSMVQVLKPTSGETPDIVFEEELLQVALLIEAGGAAVGVLRMTYVLDSFREQAAQVWTMSLIISLAIFVIGSGMMFAVGSRIAKPVLRMTSSFHHMAAGDLKQEPLVVTSDDEIGTLGKAYNDLLQQLRSLSDHARSISEGDLTRSIEVQGDLADAFRAMAATFTEIARRFDELSSSLDDRTANILTTTKQQEAGAAEEASTVSEVTATMGELAATARQIASNAESVTHSAEATATTVGQGRTALSTFVGSISDIQQGNKVINDNIVQLNRHVQQIGGIIDIINNIADRSDLLALNAALEGTKAGEAGKGFLLVAGEMRRLAENVFNSTAEIKQLIGEVTEATNATVMATESGMKSTKRGVELAQETERAFERIVDTIEQTTQASKQISVATQQQHTATDQIVSAMGEVSEVAQQSLEGIRQTASSVAELSNMASQLRKMIGRFKVRREA